MNEIKLLELYKYIIIVGNYFGTKLLVLTFRVSTELTITLLLDSAEISFSFSNRHLLSVNQFSISFLSAESKLLRYLEDNCEFLILLIILACQLKTCAIFHFHIK